MNPAGPVTCAASPGGSPAATASRMRCTVRPASKPSFATTGAATSAALPSAEKTGGATGPARPASPARLRLVPAATARSPSLSPSARLNTTQAGWTGPPASFSCTRATSVASAVAGRNATPSLCWTSSSRPGSPPASAPATSQPATTSAGTSHQRGRVPLPGSIPDRTAIDTTTSGAPCRTPNRSPVAADKVSHGESAAIECPQRTFCHRRTAAPEVSCPAGDAGATLANARCTPPPAIPRGFSSEQRC